LIVLDLDLGLVIHVLGLVLKVKGPDIYIVPLTGKPEQQQFTIFEVVY